ncbi:MAG: hypothetical protein AB7S70_06470 [Hyphomicrobium sp.]
MTSNLKVRAITLLMSVALTVDQAMAMSWLFPGWGSGGGDKGTPGAPSATPEFDSAGAIAVFALVASVAIVLYNRMRNR